MKRRERAEYYIAWLSGDGGDYGPFAGYHVDVPMPEILPPPSSDETDEVPAQDAMVLRQA